MSVHAGSIITLGGNNVIDRIQEAGLGDVRVPIETIREVGNENIVDKVPTEPDFTWTMSSFDVSTDMMATLTGATGGSGSAAAPGASDPDGTIYDWNDCEFINIPSPWKDPSAGSAGTVNAGHLVPGAYPRRARYRFGVTDNATHEVELGTGSFYYGEFAPIEEYASGDGSTTTFATAEDVVVHRKGGAGGTTFKRVFGVIVNGELQTEGVDFTTTTNSVPGTPANETITFATAPANGARIRYVYFSAEAHAYPDAVHADTLVKPGAVRGRNIKIYVGSGGSRERLASVQTMELEATVEGEVEREMGNEDIVGFSITGRDTTFTITTRSKNKDSFFHVLSVVTGVARNEVFGWFNQNTVPLTVQIENPKNPGAIIKTLYLEDAQFQPPGTPARVNQPTDFSLTGGALGGSFKEIKGSFLP